MTSQNWTGSISLVRLADMVLEWIERGRQRHHLATLDDRLAEDFCTDRNAAREEAGKPFWRA